VVLRLPADTAVLFFLLVDRAILSSLRRAGEMHGGENLDKG
jgi:hypothetical protein